MHLIAHRNGIWLNNKFKESSKEGIKFLIENYPNIYGIELDIRKTRDNILIIHHNEYTINNEKISDTNYNDFKTYIPSFLSIINLNYPSNWIIFLELKEMDTLELLINLIKKSKYINQICLTSFDINILNDIKNYKLNNNQSSFFISQNINSIKDKIIPNLDWYNWNIKSYIYNYNKIFKNKNNNIYTINSKWTKFFLNRLNINAIFTDNIELFYKKNKN